MEDIDALLDEAGGSAYVFGHSSGAALALEAAIALGSKVKKLAMYEAPYDSAPAARDASKTYNKRLTELLAAGRRGDAVALFMGLTGLPSDQIEGMRQASAWLMLEELAPTLVYDAAVLNVDPSRLAARAANVDTPTLVMAGGASYPFMREAARWLYTAMPHARLSTLEGQTHNVNAGVLVPMLVEFFAS